MDIRDLLDLKLIPVYILGVLAVIVVIALIASKGKKKDDDLIIAQTAKKKATPVHVRFAKFASRFPLTRRAYLSVRERVSHLYPASAGTIDAETGRILMPACIVALIFLLWPFIMFVWLEGFDLFYGLSGVLVAFVVFKAMTTGKLRKIRTKLRIQTQESLTRIRHFYHQTGRVDDSIAMAIKDAGDIIRPHLEDISDMLSDPELLKRTNEYAASRPDKFLLMLVSICSAVKEYGDPKTKDGQSVFLTTLGYLKEEIDMEILAGNKRDRAFQGVLGLILVPLLAVKPLEKWAVSNMPAIAQYYEGMYATVTMVIIFVVTWIVYSVVDMLIDDERNKSREDSIWARIANIEPLSTVLNRTITNNYTKYLRINAQLRGTGDHTGAKAYLVRRLAAAVATFLVTMGVLIFGTYAGKNDLLKDFIDDYASTVQATDEYKESMNEASKEMIRYHLKDGATAEEIAEEAKERYGFNTINAQTLAEAVINHREEFLSRYFKWSYALVAVIASFAASYFPLILLLVSKKSIAARQQEEVMQFQTLMLILMYVPGTTISTILEWMEKFSTCFLETITTARVNLGAGEEEALREMRDAETYEPFRSFVDNLLSIDKVGVVEAFDEVASDHDYYMRTKEQAMQASVEDRAAIAHMVQMVPLGAVLILYLIAPIVMYAADMLQVFNTAVN